MTTKNVMNPKMINIPLSALRCILTYPKDKKMLCEIDMESLSLANSPQDLDEIINDARIDYALDNYKTFSNSKDLLAELKS